MSIRNVDDVLTEAQLDEFLGGAGEDREALRPAAWSDMRPARQHAYDRLLAILASRTPPILEGDIVDPSEIRYAVACGAAARLYRLSVASGRADDLFRAMSDAYESDFSEAVAGLALTTPLGDRVATTSIAVHRR